MNQPTPPCHNLGSHRPQKRHAHLCLLGLLLGLKVVVAEVSDSTAEKHESVDADAQAGGVAGRCGGVDGANLGFLGGWVAGLFAETTTSCQRYISVKGSAQLPITAAAAACLLGHTRASGKHRSRGREVGEPAEKHVPVSSMCRREAGPASRAPRHCGRRPRTPRSHPGRRRQAEPPRLRCVGTPHVSSRSVTGLWLAEFGGLLGRCRAKDWHPAHAVQCKSRARRRTYGCSSTNFTQS